MARKPSVKYPGAIDHVLNRGDRREPIFKNDQDRMTFLDALAAVCTKTAWQVHACMLMPNHFHLLVKAPRRNLVAGVNWFLGTYPGRLRAETVAWIAARLHLGSRHYANLLLRGIPS